MTAVELTTYGHERHTRSGIESVNGVGEVFLWGSRRREIQVRHGIRTAWNAVRPVDKTDVANALRSQNLELPGGRLEQGARESSAAAARSDASAGLRISRNLVIATHANSAIRIRDVGVVQDTVPTRFRVHVERTVRGEQRRTRADRA